MDIAPSVRILKDGRKLYGIFLEADPRSKAHARDLGNLYHHVGKPHPALIGIDRRILPATSWYDHTLRLRTIGHSEKFESPDPKSRQKPKTVRGQVTVLGLDLKEPASVQAKTFGARASESVPIAGAWEGGKFSVTAYSAQAQSLLERIYKAFPDGKVAMWIDKLSTGLPPTDDGSKTPEHQIEGLFITIPAKMPASVLTWLEGADRHVSILGAIAESTSIEKRLRRAAERYKTMNPTLAKALRNCTLKPVYLKDIAPAILAKERRSASRHKIAFLLDAATPYPGGYYTVEELEQWLDGRGPIQIDAPKPKIAETSKGSGNISGAAKR